MAATFVHEGKSIDYTPASDVALGAVVVLGDLVGIAQRAITANTRGTLTVAGVFDLPKASGASTAIALGANLYWDEAEGVAKTDSESGANKLIGKCIKAAVDADTTVRTRLM